MLPLFVNLGPGETQKLLTVTLINDQILENTEMFAVRISVLDEDTRVNPDTTTISILDDDSTLFCNIYFVLFYLFLNLIRV